jgi:hypothetical protein
MERPHRDPYIEPGQLTLSIGEEENRTTLNDAVPPSKRDADVLRRRCYFTVINVQRWEGRWPPCLMGIIYPTLKRKKQKKQPSGGTVCVSACFPSY